MTAKTLRLDKWLWFARLVRTRSQASRLIVAGKIRVNRKRVTKPAAAVKEDDVVTAVINRRIRVVRVAALGVRRGPASEAVQLYDEMTPVESGSKAAENGVATHRPAAAREPGSGRPTKRERRKLDTWRRRSLEAG